MNATAVEARPLEGFAVGVTAARRHEELAALLERRGARVVHAPAIRIVPLSDDAGLLAATRECLDRPFDHAVVTTGIGFRSWLETAESRGLREALVARLAGARVLARGPKARGAVRAAGLHEEWSPPGESCDEILDRLLASGPARGRRVAVQLYGEPLPEFTGALRAAGFEVVEVPVYRWSRTDDNAALRRLVARTVAGTVDAITFTSAPAVAATLAAADDAGLRDALLAALRADVMAACVGPVTAAALTDLGVPTVQPARARIGALVRAVVADLPEQRARRVRLRAGPLELRGHAVVLDGELLPIPPAPMAVLRALARRPGHVVSQADLCRVLPGRGEGAGRADEHAVEMAVARLRRALRRPGIVETVVKRGYRLGCEPPGRART